MYLKLLDYYLEQRRWAKLPVEEVRKRQTEQNGLLTTPVTDVLNLDYTSGSTGVPFRIYQTKLEDSEVIYFCYLNGAPLKRMEDLS